MSSIVSPAENNLGHIAGPDMRGAHRRPRKPRTKGATASLQAFYDIARLWRLSVAEQMILLGLAARSTFFQWKRSGGAILPRDTAERIFYLRGIHQAAMALLPDGAAPHAWLRQPGRTPVAPDSSLLRRMLLGRVIDLYAVHAYLTEAAKTAVPEPSETEAS